MILNKVYINNYKSLVDLSIVNPNPLTVFFGTNASGKSNLFEALEFISFSLRKSENVVKYFGKFNDLYPYKKHGDERKQLNFLIESTEGKVSFDVERGSEDIIEVTSTDPVLRSGLANNFSRIFLGETRLKKEILQDDKKLDIDGSNIVDVLYRIFTNQKVKEEFLEWLTLLIPELRDIEIVIDEISGKNNLLVWEEYSPMPFKENLISDGTKNIISLLTVLFQSEEPQFLLIEEPENGLNPKIIKEYIRLLREICSKKNNNIWINTHSQSLVAELTPKEAVLVYKEHGFTQIRQFHDLNLYDLKMDEAWLSNVLGGGIPW